jgi:hypothetical protein
MTPTLASVARIIEKRNPSRPARVSLFAFLEERLFGVSLLGAFIAAAGLAILSAGMRLLLGQWVYWLDLLCGPTIGGTFGGATAGTLLGIPLVLLLLGLRERRWLTLGIWAICVVVMAGVGGIGETIGGWAGWMIAGGLVGILGGRFLETK